MTRIATALLLALLVGTAGCKKNNPNGTAGGGGGGGSTEGFRFRPEGGSTTIPGKSRDRALDAEIMNEMRQVKVGLDADYPDGRTPADKTGWLAFLRGYKNLRKLVNDGEVIAYDNVNLRGLRDPANTVLMYEQRIVKHNDGIVLTCDGTPRRMNKAQFDALAKPK